MRFKSRKKNSAVFKRLSEIRFFWLKNIDCIFIAVFRTKILSTGLLEWFYRRFCSKLYTTFRKRKKMDLLWQNKTNLPFSIFFVRCEINYSCLKIMYATETQLYSKHLLDCCRSVTFSESLNPRSLFSQRTLTKILIYSN